MEYQHAIAPEVLYSKIEFIDGFASLLHESWRASRKEIVGQFAIDGQPLRESRFKPVVPSDENSTNTVDIANTPYSDLPEAWKIANREASRAIMHIFDEMNSENPRVTRVIDLEEAAARTHVNW